MLILQPFRRALWQKCRQLSLVRYCSRSASKIEGSNKQLTLNEVRQREAEKFLANLDAEMQQKLNKVYMLQEGMKYEAHRIPEILTDQDLHYILVNCDTTRSILKYFEYLFVRNMHQINAKKKKEERRQSKPESKDRLESEAYSVYSPTRDALDKKRLAIEKYVVGQPFVIDLDYDVSTREQIEAWKQLRECYGMNYRAPLGFHLHCTGIDKNKGFLQEYQHGLLDTYLMDIHEKPFWEIFPREKLVYLSPDAPKLRGYDGDSVFVMGGIVDIKGQHSNSSFAKAKELGIRSGSLPIRDYVKLSGSAGLCLPLQHVMAIMLKVNLHQNWQRAIHEGLPKSQRFTLVDRSFEILRQKRTTRRASSTDWQLPSFTPDQLPKQMETIEEKKARRRFSDSIKTLKR